jgi:hypothetical protein
MRTRAIAPWIFRPATCSLPARLRVIEARAKSKVRDAVGAKEEARGRGVDRVKVKAQECPNRWNMIGKP